MSSPVCHRRPAAQLRRLIVFFAALVLSAGTAAADELRGHYLSFDLDRDLKTELVDVLADPKSNSNYHVKMAQRLDDALRTPGVRGIWMKFAWRDLEVGDGVYDWTRLDRNMDVARDYGLVLIVAVGDRSFNGSEVMPAYFPSRYVLATEGGGNHGFTAKRWDPYVYNRMIRIYKAIAQRYAGHEGFGGIATTETATGNFDGGDYTLEKYQDALAAILTETQQVMSRGRLFFYMNFLKGGDRSDMNQDGRVALLRRIPHQSLVVGAPDVTPDVPGMVRSASVYRVHVRKTMPSLEQFCHLQHVDQGAGGVNVKSNAARTDYFDEIAAVRDRERQSWFGGEPAVFERDDLRDPKGNRVDMHPASVLGELWRPDELLAFGRRNFDCDYFFWHYREFPKPEEIQWPEVQETIARNPCFYLPDGCDSVEQPGVPTPPNLW